jgi:hypothetical protein
MIKNLKDSIIEDLCRVRTEGFESSFIKQYGQIKESEETLRSEEELISLIRKCAIDEKMQSEIGEKIDRLVFSLFKETQFWNKKYYELGFFDGIQLSKEISCEKEITAESKEKEDTFFAENADGLTDFIEKKKFQMLKTKEDYKQLITKVSKIKQEYPKLREYLEDDNISVLSKEELKALLKIIEISNDISAMEMEEMFKLGIKECKLL